MCVGQATRDEVPGEHYGGAATAGMLCTARQVALLQMHAGMRKHMSCGCSSSSIGS